MCRFKEVTCYNCGKLGHLKAVCRKERKQPSGRKTKPPIRSNRKPGKRVHHLEGKLLAEGLSSEDYPLYHIMASVKSGTR